MASGNVRCPRCGSTQFTANKKGFGLGGAIVGGVLLGPVGLLGGFAGSGQVKITCLNCGHEWEPSAARLQSSSSGGGSCLWALFIAVAIGGIGSLMMCGGFMLLGSFSANQAANQPNAKPIQTAKAETRPTVKVPAKPLSEPMSEPTVASAPVLTPLPAPEPTVLPTPVPSAPDPPKETFDALQLAERTREFVSADKKFTVEAVFISLDGDTVTLRRVETSKSLEVPITKLSNADRVWIRRIHAEDKKNGIPPVAKKPVAAEPALAATTKDDDDAAPELSRPQEKAREKALMVGSVCFTRSKGTGDKTIAITFKTGGGMLKVYEVPQGAKATLLAQNSGDFLPSTTDEMFAVRIEEGEFSGKSGIVYASCVWAK